MIRLYSEGGGSNEKDQGVSLVLIRFAQHERTLTGASPQTALIVGRGRRSGDFGSAFLRLLEEEDEEDGNHEGVAGEDIPCGAP